MSKNLNLSGNLFTKQKLTIKETPLSAQIAEYLSLRRIYNDRLNSGAVEVVRKSCVKGVWKTYQNWMQLCKKGTPDRFAILCGFIIFIEVKMLGKEPTDDQLTRHDELRASGAIVIVADSFDSFKEQFNEVERKIKIISQAISESNILVRLDS